MYIVRVKKDAGVCTSYNFDSLAVAEFFFQLMQKELKFIEKKHNIVLIEEYSKVLRPYTDE